MNELSLTYCNETIDFKVKLEENFVEFGKRLHEIKTNELYLGQWTDWTEYCWELGISEGTASKYMTVYKRYVLGLGFSPAKIAELKDFTAAYTLQTSIKDDGELKAKFDEISGASGEHKNDILQEARNGISRLDCKHSETYKVEICKVCGKHFKVYEEN